MATYWEKLKDPRWQKKRLEVLQRAGFACENCHATDKTLHVHHGYYDRGMEPWEYADETLWCLCEECHEDAEGQRCEVYRELAVINPCHLAPNMVFPYQSTEDLERMAKINPKQCWRLKAARSVDFAMVDAARLADQTGQQHSFTIDQNGFASSPHPWTPASEDGS